MATEIDHIQHLLRQLEARGREIAPGYQVLAYMSIRPHLVRFAVIMPKKDIDAEAKTVGAAYALAMQALDERDPAIGARTLGIAS